MRLKIALVIFILILLLKIAYIIYFFHRPVTEFGWSYPKAGLAFSYLLPGTEVDFRTNCLDQQCSQIIEAYRLDNSAFSILIEAIPGECKELQDIDNQGIAIIPSEEIAFSHNNGFKLIATIGIYDLFINQYPELEEEKLLFLDKQTKQEPGCVTNNGYLIDKQLISIT